MVLHTAYTTYVVGVPLIAEVIFANATFIPLPITVQTAAVSSCAADTINFLLPVVGDDSLGTTIVVGAAAAAHRCLASLILAFANWASWTR
jgi:hypothetical protein